MKKFNSIVLALILAVISAVAVYIFVGGIDGKSSYQLAAEEGYTGTQSEWLASLVGQDGLDGESLDLTQLWQDAIELGEIDEDTTLIDFLKYVIGDTTSALELSIQNSLTCSVSIYAMCGAVSQSGSGTIIRLDEDGTAYILTNYHVTYFNNSSSAIRHYYIIPYQYDYLISTGAYTSGFAATYVGGIAAYDIAVLKVSQNSVFANGYQNGTLTAANFADDDTLYLGQTCYTIGNSLGLGMSVTQGVVSHLSDSYMVQIGSNSYSMHGTRVSALINSGNSGGGLFNENGQLIGVINAKKAVSDDQSTPIEAFSLAVPLLVAKGVAEQIIKQCDGDEITTPTLSALGIKYSVAGSSQILNAATGHQEVTLSLSVVTSNVQGLSAGDIITSVEVNLDDGSTEIIKISSIYSLSDYILGLDSGTKLTIYYDRPMIFYYYSGSVTITL